MALFTRREAPPADVVAYLDRGERALAWADVDDGTVVVATPRGLWWPDDGDGHHLIGWQFVDRAVWREDVLTITAAEVLDDVLLVDLPPVAARLVKARDLPSVVRKRVEANVVRSQVRPLPGGAGRFVGRRTPGRDGVSWWVRLEPGTADNPVVRDQIDVVLAELRSQWTADPESAD
ncbi:MAG: hypothetical protein M3O28_10745 [Actinomycetota bacterium]|nr:hypothetical protein [Actinomycetota bacterium]